MANKVLSIKMDERDINRLKKYYDALTKSGFLPVGTMSLNGFLKHLLLDYLEEDLCRAFSIYSKYGISPRCLNPEMMNDDNNVQLINSYNLDNTKFEMYKNCVKEELMRNVDMMKNNTELFNEVVNSRIGIKEGLIFEMKCFSIDDKNEKENSFWEDKAFCTMDLHEKEYKNLGIDEDIDIIEKSSLSEEIKLNLINEILEYEKKKKQNYIITRGRGI